MCAAVLPDTSLLSDYFDTQEYTNRIASVIFRTTVHVLKVTVKRLPN